MPSLYIFCVGEPADLYDTTNPDWVPSLRMGHTISQAPSQDRYNRAERRRKRKRLASDTEECRNDSISSEPKTCSLQLQFESSSGQTDDGFTQSVQSENQSIISCLE